ncbi:hypothetical protein [Maridesulfovibrio ferrireducens]|uniref:hypothetical protein n=1 Tax=Maridesulfovibrio ferrireducens TaxID=246191 RepID=UPI001A2D0018|nr:hypothetical protein [Maridesulfovibrio ferrireducens]MBI9110086.1 hypothetical protein [Maridesulfovibrio ferrireducens]
MSAKEDDSRLKLLKADKKLMYQLIRQGDLIGENYGYPNLRGMDAICRYCADKYNWLPDQTRRLNTEDLVIILEGV